MTLSRALLQYIAHNIHYLKDFGSLQTSLGVWLSSIDNKRNQDDSGTLKKCEDFNDLADNVS